VRRNGSSPASTTGLEHAVGDIVGNRLIGRGGTGSWRTLRRVGRWGGRGRRCGRGSGLIGRGRGEPCTRRADGDGDDDGDEDNDSSEETELKDGLCDEDSESAESESDEVDGLRERFSFTRGVRRGTDIGVMGMGARQRLGCFNNI
jgi:hypothetical protein